MLGELGPADAARPEATPSGASRTLIINTSKVAEAKGLFLHTACAGGRREACGKTPNRTVDDTPATLSSNKGQQTTQRQLREEASETGPRREAASPLWGCAERSSGEPGKTGPTLSGPLRPSPRPLPLKLACVSSERSYDV